MCEKVFYKGMKLREEQDERVTDGEFWAVPLACAQNLCDKCGVKRFLQQHHNNSLSTNESIVLNRFMLQPRAGKDGGKSVMELTKVKVNLTELLKHLTSDMIAYNEHCFWDRWGKRTYKLCRESLREQDALGLVDYTAGMAFCSSETITCTSDNYGYCEVFFVTIGRRRVGGLNPGEGTDVYTNLVFFFLGEASSEYKDNDHVAHKVHEDEVVRVLKEKYGIASFVFQSDQCRGQYMCKFAMANVAFRLDDDGLEKFIHMFSE
jgi:hypothetical protein